MIKNKIFTRGFTSGEYFYDNDYLLLILLSIKVSIS